MRLQNDGAKLHELKTARVRKLKEASYANGAIIAQIHEAGAN